MNLEHIQTLTVNPFFCSSILVHFFSGYGQRDIPISLTYFVLPLILNKRTRNIFNEINKRTTFFDIIKNNKSLLIDLQDKTEKLKKVTNLSLIVAHNNNQIIIAEEIKLLQNLDYKTEDTELQEFYRSSYYLGYVFGSEKNFINIFQFINTIE